MSPINLEIKDKIAIATMDYPPVNALSADANNEIIQLFDSFHTNKDVNVVVLTASGSRAFCAGVDLNSRLPSGNSQNDPSAHYRRARETFNSIYECAVPVIGAINGPAIGAGLAIAASAAATALPSPEASPVPIIALPISDITVFISEKSKFIIPG